MIKRVTFVTIAVLATVTGLIYIVLFGGPGTAIVPMGLVGGAVSLLPDRERVRQALRNAAIRYGLNPDWLEAIGWVESRWRVGAVGDGGRSVGPTQIQRRTLWNNGYKGSGDELLSDPELAAEWTAKLMIAGARNAEGVKLIRTPQTLNDLAAWWNAGKQTFEDLPVDNPARTDYAPKLAIAFDSITSGGVA